MTMKHYSAYTTLLLAAVAMLMTACAGDTAENNFNNENATDAGSYDQTVLSFQHVRSSKKTVILSYSP